MIKPDFFNGHRMSEIYQPRCADVISDATYCRASKDIEPSCNDAEKIALFVIDAQVDFCIPTGTLFVPGSVEDNIKISQFIFDNLEKITNIVCTLDTHYVYQIFHPSWWHDEKGNNPEPFTLISKDDIINGKFKALRNPKWALEYCEKLEEQGKKQLCIWPYHCLLGTCGHSLVPALAEFILYHSFVRISPITYLQKGTLPDTEYYSVFGPEVKTNHPQGQFNTKFFTKLIEHDKVYISGQASSHCVLESILDMKREIGKDKDLLNKIYILEDCMSPVPNIKDGDGNVIADFEKLVKDSFAEFKKDGMHIVKSTDDI